jgi:polar amino acid transport system substrate-binding protein
LINGYFSEGKVRDKFSSLNGIRLLKDEVAEVPLHFIISRSMDNATQYMREFNTALKRIEQNGTRHEIDISYQHLLKANESHKT